MHNILKEYYSFEERVKCCKSAQRSFISLDELFIMYFRYRKSLKHDPLQPFEGNIKNNMNNKAVNRQ